jgi:hypothetical protein
MNRTTLDLTLGMLMIFAVTVAILLRDARTAQAHRLPGHWLRGDIALSAPAVRRADQHAQTPDPKPNRDREGARVSRA